MAELGTVEHLAEEVRRIWDGVPPSARSCIQEVQNATRFVSAEYAVNGLASAAAVAAAHQQALDNRYGPDWPELPIVRMLLRTQCGDAWHGRLCPQAAGHDGLHGNPDDVAPRWCDYGTAGWALIGEMGDGGEVFAWTG